MFSVGITTQNKINNTGFSYDAAGNLTGDGSFSYTWDAESRTEPRGAGSRGPFEVHPFR